MAERRRDEGKEAYWRKALERHSRSGVSVRAFCKQEQLTESAFYAWRQTIRQRDASSASRQSAPAFVPARVTEPGSADLASAAPVRPDHSSASIVVELTGGCTLRLPESTSAARVVELVDALERRGAR